jgi:hypothetical protein
LRWGVAADAPPHLGIAGTEEVLATFSGEVADRHLPPRPAPLTPGRKACAC